MSRAHILADTGHGPLAATDDARQHETASHPVLSSTQAGDSSPSHTVVHNLIFSRAAPHGQKLDPSHDAQPPLSGDSIWRSLQLTWNVSQVERIGGALSWVLVGVQGRRRGRDYH